MNHSRPITTHMADALRLGGVEPEPRIKKMLVRRGLMQDNRVTQQGREALGRYCRQHTDLIEPVVVRCRYWQTFYGLFVEIRYQDDPTWTRLEYPRSFDSTHQALCFILQDLTGPRCLLLACSPERVLNPDEENQ